MFQGNFYQSVVHFCTTLYQLFSKVITGNVPRQNLSDKKDTNLFTIRNDL